MKQLYITFYFIQGALARAYEWTTRHLTKLLHLLWLIPIICLFNSRNLFLIGLVAIITGVVIFKLRKTIKNARNRHKADDMDAPTRATYLIKEDILNNPLIIDFYAPARDFTHRPTDRQGKLLPAVTDEEARREQTRHKIGVFVTGDEAEFDEDHFYITLDLDGRATEQVKKLTPLIKSTLGLFSIEQVSTDDYFNLTFLCHRTPPVDRLIGQTFSAELFTEKTKGNNND